MEDQRRSRRDSGLAAVTRWTRRAVAGGIVLAGVLGAGLAHLLPGQAASVRHDAPSPVESASPETADPAPSTQPTSRPHHLVPPSTPPHRSHGHPHATSGGS